MVPNIAANYHVNNMEHADLVQEGYIVYCSCKDKWNPEQSKFSTWFVNNLKFHYGHLVQRQKPVAEEYEDHLVADQKKNNLVLILCSLSKEALEVVNLVLNSPMELLAMTNCNYPTKNAIMKYIKKKGWGWKEETIYQTFEEIKSVLQ
jgi:hypothetical protein